ncbi:uncharacterized protein LOC122005221 [Zingiber officinale]|uniref:Uncharacterized protein n=1 Tax=Zingiber officinale TaxID=94328 RepID=A0A8J5FR06_ZINOF|nr:uncharacterized protein LOC122005221 [Zingiber officinale]KAG6488801.1 hypothetical protein ZIOFF_050052 [Zingiber officinale]
MSSSEHGECITDTREDVPDSITRLMDYIPICIPTVDQELPGQNHSEKRFLDFLRAKPSTDWFFTRRRFRVPFVRKIDRRALIRYLKKWIKNPENIALVIWLMFVAAGLFMLFLVITGSLNQVIRSSTERKKWTEIIYQILNALFTIMCIYQHPRLFHHLVLLCRWRLPDRVALRAGYCKDGSRRAHERAHIMLVVILLHITIFSQYVLCGLYWGYSRKDRPDWAVNLCTGIGIAAPIIAGVYSVFGPIGRNSDDPEDATVTQEVQSELVIYNNRRVVVTNPEWIGGLFDCWDDRTVCLASFFCTCCVFGWNMERLGLGNMYVHIVTFLLLIVAPLMVFSVSALNVENNAIRYIVGVSGILLGVFGLVYGGIWRTQMRKRFKLPANPFCCGYPAVTDSLQWLFCWSCSLAQEVRTGNFYDIEEDSFCKEAKTEDGVLVPLPREDGSGFTVTSNGKLLLRSSSCPATLDPPSHLSYLRSSTQHVMVPPLPALMQIDED